MERGLRQGDPMAPFLFLIVVECLNIMVKEAMEKGMFKGVKVGNEDIMLSHLQYADAIIFFGEWESGNIKNLINSWNASMHSRD